MFTSVSFDARWDSKYGNNNKQTLHIISGEGKINLVRDSSLQVLHIYSVSSKNLCYHWFHSAARIVDFVFILLVLSFIWLLC